VDGDIVPADERRADDLSAGAPPLRGIMSSTRWLLLPVEVKTRAFESRLFLGAHAVAAGWNVVIGRKSALNSALRSLPRGLYLDKCIQAASISKTQYAKALGNVYAAIDEEGLVHEGGSQTYPKRRMSPETLAETAKLCAWGDAQADVVRAAMPPLADRVVVTGNPRVDLWRPEMQGLHRAQVDRIRESVGNYVFFPSNFANVVGADGRQLTEQYGHVSGHYSDPAERARFEGYLDLRHRILERLEIALPRLAGELPDGHKLVIRPHPAEDHAFWERVIGTHPNIELHYEGTITPWLLGADAIVHSNCTSGVEASVAGVPCIAYSPYDDSAFPMLPNEISRVVDSDEDLVTAANDAIAGRPVVPEDARAVVDHHLAAVRGPLASENLLDVFDALPVREDTGDGRQGRRRSDELRMIRVRVRKQVRKRRRAEQEWMPPISGKLADQKFPATDLEEVEDILGRFAAELPRLGGASVAPAGQSLFRLSPGDS
jgi:surface carbohydrate biosynthesis protein